MKEKSRPISIRTVAFQSKFTDNICRNEKIDIFVEMWERNYSIMFPGKIKGGKNERLLADWRSFG
jgi:hypothetical protein